MVDLIKELEAKVAVKRAELEDEERALAVVRRMMGQTTQGHIFDVEVKEPSEPVKFEDLFGGAPNIKKRSFIDDVQKSFSHFGENEFEVSHVETALTRMGIVIDAKSPRSRISVVMGKLVKDNVVEQVFKGAGNVPHRYKIKNTEQV